MSNFFFISKNNIQKNNFQFDSDESHHLINVMRLNIGSEIYFTDGEGGSYIGSISSLDNDIVSGNILDVHKVGNTIETEIVNKVDFGIFVKIYEEIVNSFYLIWSGFPCSVRDRNFKVLIFLLDFFTYCRFTGTGRR